MEKKRIQTLGSGSSGRRVSPKLQARQITEIDTIVGRRIRFRRLTLDLSSEEVAAKIGVAHQQLLKYESARNRVSAARLYKLAAVLDVPVHWFFTEPASEAGTSPAFSMVNGKSEGTATGEELAELIRLYTAITDGEVRSHYLQSLRILHRASSDR
jgi:transcriptional regulator with XRE-family HTH domain